MAVLFYTGLTEKLDYPSSGSRRSAGPSCKMTFNNELCTFRSPLYSMKPSLRNLHYLRLEGGRSSLASGIVSNPRARSTSAMSVNGT